MSIDNIRKFFEKSGCAMIVAIGIILILVVGLFSQSTCNKHLTQTQEGQQAIATIGDFQVTVAKVDAGVEQTKSFFRQFGQDTLTPIMEAQFTAGSLKNVVKEGTVVYLAKKDNVTVSDEKISDKIDAIIKDNLQQAREQFIMQKKLTDKATDAEFEKVFKDEAKKSVEDFKKEIKQKGSEPDAKAHLEMILYREGLQNKIAKGITVTEDDVKKSFNQYEVQALTISYNDQNKAEKKAKADSILAEIKGGAEFGKEIEKYKELNTAQDQFPDDKPAGEKTQKISGKEIALSPELKPLESLKEGDVSGVIESDNAFKIFKLKKVEAKLPEGYDKDKTKFKETYLNEIATKKLDEQVNNALKTDIVKWNIKGYKVMFDWAELGEKKRAGKISDAEFKTDLKAIIKSASEASNADPQSLRPATLTRYAATEELWNDSKPQEQKEIADLRIESLSAVLDVTESVEVRLELAKMLLDKKDKGAYTQILQAAQANGVTNPAGADSHNKIKDYTEELKKLNLASPEELKKIDDEQTRFETEMAEFKKQQEEERKQAEEDRKKAEEEEAKMKAEDEKAAAKENAPTEKKTEGAKPEEKKSEPSLLGGQKSGQ